MTFINRLLRLAMSLLLVVSACIVFNDFSVHCFWLNGDYNGGYYQGRSPRLEQPIFNGEECGFGAHQFEWMTKVNSFGCKSKSQSIVHKSRRINGGYEAALSEFPSYVQVKRIVLDGKSNYCGGALINHDTVLTAGHCIKEPDENSAYIIYAGSVHSQQGEAREAMRICRPKLYKTNKMAIDETLSAHDWAIIKLTEGFTYGPTIQPACLNLRSKLDPSVECVVAGMGRTMEGAKRSLTLKAGLMRQCEGRPPFNVSGTLCFEAGSDDQLKGKACKGDSGGPIYCYTNCEHRTRMVVVGVVSGGNYASFRRQAGRGHLRSTCVIQNQEIFTDLAAHGEYIDRLINLMGEPTLDKEAEEDFDCFEYQ